MLKQRIITAAILVPITLLLVIYLPSLPFALVTLALVLGAAWEWSALMQLTHTSQLNWYLSFLVICCFAGLIIFAGNLILIPVYFLLSLFFILGSPALLIVFALLACALVVGVSRKSRFNRKLITRYTCLRVAYLALILLCCCSALLIPVIYILALAFVWWVLAALLVVSYPQGVSYWRHPVIRGVMGILVLVPCWCAINFIRNLEEGLFVLFYLFGIIWGADIVAYFAGKRWGKNKMLPEVSPGKSWQGFIAALLYAVLFAIVVSWRIEVATGVMPWAVLLSVITACFSVIGDLTESMIKRLVGVKDSGTILPGHGGILDRIDSLTAAAPIFALGALLVGAYLL